MFVGKQRMQRYACAYLEAGIIVKIDAHQNLQSMCIYLKNNRAKFHPDPL